MAGRYHGQESSPPPLDFLDEGITQRIPRRATRHLPATQDSMPNSAVDAVEVKQDTPLNPEARSSRRKSQNVPEPIELGGHGNRINAQPVSLGRTEDLNPPLTDLYEPQAMPKKMPPPRKPIDYKPQAAQKNMPPRKPIDYEPQAMPKKLPPPRKPIDPDRTPWYSTILFRGVPIKIKGSFPQAWVWILCLFSVICFLVLFLTVGIVQRPFLGVSTTAGEEVINLARTWKEQHPTASQTPVPILQSDLPAGLSVDHAYVLYAWQAAQKASIDPKIFVRQINEESGFNPQAVSPAGAIGIAQFIPSTAAGLSNPLGSGQLDPWNPQEALTAAALYMAAKLQTYGGDYAKALASYNAGSGGVQHAINTAIQTDGTPDTWRKYLPAETQRYILIILGQ